MSVSVMHPGFETQSPAPPTAMQTQAESAFFRELEGVRGFAFLAVFFAHYVWSAKGLHSLSLPRFLDVGLELAYVTVPIFFVLSGFLITRVLLKSRERNGYFRVFYLRRFVRILPLYYVIWIGIGVLRWAGGADVPFYGRNLLFVSNWIAGAHADILWRGQAISTGHFWSLCMEEQFYLLWPLVIWLCRSTRSLKNTCFVLLGVAAVCRFAWPLTHRAAADAYFHSLTRFDALVLGALMAVYFESRAYMRVERYAVAVALAGCTVLLVVGFCTGTGQLQCATTFWREMWLIPVINVTALAVILAVMRRGSRLQGLCQGKTITKLGSLTYGAYAFHFLYAPFFTGPVCSRLMQHMTAWFAVGASSMIAFVLTMSLAWVAYKLVEEPGLRLKTRIRFGTEKERGSRPAWIGAAALWLRAAIERPAPQRAGQDGTSRPIAVMMARMRL